MPTVLTQAPPAPAWTPWRVTRAEYRQLAEMGLFNGRRTELIRGEVRIVSPPSWPHSSAVVLVGDALRIAFAGLGWVNVQSPVEAAESEPQPDVAVYPGSVRDYADHPSMSVLVVEVAYSSLTEDLTEKAELFAEAGFPEYWVVDLNAKELHILRDPRAIPAGGYRYFDVRVVGAADSVAPLGAPGSPVRVVDLLP